MDRMEGTEGMEGMEGKVGNNSFFLPCSLRFSSFPPKSSRKRYIKWIGKGNDKYFMEEKTRNKGKKERKKERQKAESKSRELFFFFFSLPFPFFFSLSFEETYNFTRSSCDFFGMISSICGARRGYVSTILVRMARWTEDFTLDLAPGVMLFLFITGLAGFNGLARCMYGRDLRGG